MSEKNICNIFYSPRMSMSPFESPWPFKLIRRQFPIIVSYAMTINKSQGQSLYNVGLYLAIPVFSHGQLYVVFSRVTIKSGLKILIHDKQNAPCSTTTNVVYKEVFQTLCQLVILFTLSFVIKIKSQCLIYVFKFHIFTLVFKKMLNIECLTLRQK